MGFFFTLVLTALLYVRPQEYVAAIKGWPIMDWVAIACLAGVFLEGSFSAEKLRRSPINWLLIFFWFQLGASWLLNDWLGGIVFQIVHFSPVAIMYFLVVLTVDTMRKLKLFIWTLVFFCSFLALESMLVFYTGAGMTGATALMRGEVLQTKGVGIFADPNDIAINMVPMTAFLLPAFHKGLLTRSWIPGFAFLMPFINGIILTRSRGGMLGLLSVGWMYLRRRTGLVFAIIGIAVALALVLSLPRMGDIDTQEGSARTRLDHWSYGLQLFKTHPIMGVGVGNFADIGNYTHTAHNSLVLVMAETGFVGTFFWISMLLCFFMHLRAIRGEDRAPPWSEPFNYALESAMVGWLTCAFFLSQTYKPLLFILMALAVASLNVIAKENGVDLTLRWNARMTMLGGLTTAASIVLMYIALRVLWAM